MALFSRRRYPRFISPANLETDLEAMVASAAELRGGPHDSELRRTLPLWQRQALEFYDLLGECWFPAQFYSRQLARVRLHPGIRQPNGEVDEVEEPGAQEVLARIHDTSGGQAGWLSQYGTLQFLIGDGNLVGSVREGEERWEYLSPAEFKRNGPRKFQRIEEPGQQPVDLTEAPADAEKIGEGQARAWRLWTPHPTHSKLSDAPVRAVLPLYTYLMLVDKAAAAQALSRIVGSGILVIADEITLPGTDPQTDDRDAEQDPLLAAIIKHVITPIADPGSASAVAPLILRAQIGERSVEELIKLIQLHDPNQTADWQQRIEKAITRIAIGLDMPPEEFLGLSGANHWTGWVITEEKWKAHGEPRTIRLCGDLTSAYYRQACIAAKVPDADKLIVWYDAAQVTTHPDQGKDANEVHDRGGLADKALRRAHNFSERDAPSEAERKFYEAVKLKISARPPDQPGEPVSDTGSDVKPGAAGNGADPGPRTSSPSPMNDGQARAGAAYLALEECRRRAGNRLRAKQMSCDGCFNGTENIPNQDLAAHVGVDVVRAVGITSEAALVAGGAETFATLLSRSGMTTQKAGFIAALIERHAADTIYDAAPSLPDDILQEV